MGRIKENAKQEELWETVEETNGVEMLTLPGGVQLTVGPLSGPDLGNNTIRHRGVLKVNDRFIAHLEGVGQVTTQELLARRTEELLVERIKQLEEAVAILAALRSCPKTTRQPF